MASVSNSPTNVQGTCIISPRLHMIVSKSHLTLMLERVSNHLDVACFLSVEPDAVLQGPYYGCSLYGTQGLATTTNWVLGSLRKLERSASFHMYLQIKVGLQCYACLLGPKLRRTICTGTASDWLCILKMVNMKDLLMLTSFNGAM